MTDAHTVTSIAYGDAQARGQLRHWKRRLAESYAIFRARYHDSESLAPLIEDMVKGSRAARRGALEKLTKAFGPGVRLESAQLKRGASIGVWSILKPRESVVDSIPDSMNISESDRASLEQDCVCVNYIVAGRREHDGKFILGEGLWTLEVPDHALGRAVERSRLLHPETIIREAHATLLDLPASAPTPSQYLKAGSGCFVGGLILGDDVRIGASVHFRAKTWLANDMLGSDQIPLDEKGEPGKRLGDALLLPYLLWTDDTASS
jgi:hypothetical protein